MDAAYSNSGDKCWANDTDLFARFKRQSKLAGIYLVLQSTALIMWGLKGLDQNDEYIWTLRNASRVINGNFDVKYFELWLSSQVL